MAFSRDWRHVSKVLDWMLPNFDLLQSDYVGWRRRACDVIIFRQLFWTFSSQLTLVWLSQGWRETGKSYECHPSSIPIWNVTRRPRSSSGMRSDQCVSQRDAKEFVVWLKSDNLVIDGDPGLLCLIRFAVWEKGRLNFGSIEGQFPLRASVRNDVHHNLGSGLDPLCCKSWSKEGDVICILVETSKDFLWWDVTLSTK